MKNYNNRKILILSLIFVFVICIGAVSATDDVNAVNDTQEVLTSQNDVNVDIQTTTENNDVISAGEGSFADLSNKVNAGGDTVDLTQDYMFKFTDSKDGVTIAKDNMVINGNGHTINGDNKAKIFVINANNVVLKNIIFVKSYGGSAVYLNGTNNKIDNCTFQDNTFEDGSGAAVYAGNFTTIVNSNFMNNKALKGGAICGVGINSTIINSKFSGNIAGKGGAIYWLEDNITISKSNFTNNTCENYEVEGQSYLGGAICGEKTTILQDCNFIGNVGWNAAAVFIWNKALISNCKFENNWYTQCNAAIRIGANSYVYNTIFLNNSGVKTAFSPALNFMGANGTVDNCTFDNNPTGAIIIQNNGENCSVLNCKFMNHNLTTSGNHAVVLVGKNYALISNSSFINNDAYSIRVNSKYADIRDSTFNNNNKTCIMVNSQNCLIYNSTFNNNKNNMSSDAFGAAIYLNGNAKDSIVSNSNFNNNIAKTAGGAIIMNCEGLEIHESTFNNNSAQKGGAIYINRPYCKVYDSTFTNNKATYNGYDEGGGGAIHAYKAYQGSSSEYTVICNSTFINNTAATTGGAMRLRTYGYTVSDCTFINNTELSTDSGGGAIQAGSNGTVSNSVFIGNKGYRGASFYVQGANVVVDNSTFIANSATAGAGVYIYGVSNCQVLNSVFINNTAIAGAGINNNNGANFVVSSCTFINNIASQRGGAVSDNKNSIVKYSAFINSTDSKNNGYEGIVSQLNWFGSNNPTYGSSTTYLKARLAAIDNGNYLVSGELNPVIKVEFYSSANGEVVNEIIAARPLTYTINNYHVTFEWSSTSQTGRLLGNDQAEQAFIISDVKVDDENLGFLTFTGFALHDSHSFNDLQLLINGLNLGETLILNKDYTYAQGDSNPINIAKTITLAGDVSISGDGKASILNITADKVVIKDLTLTKGKSNADGGAVLWSGNDGKVNGVKFSDNTADGLGGAIYWTGNNSNIEDAIFTNNQALNGSALYINTNNSIISNSVFDKNKGASIFINASKAQLTEVSVSNSTLGIFVSGNETVVKKVTLGDIEGVGLIIDGNNSQISAVTLDNIKGTGIDINDYVKIQDITVNGGKGTSINIKANNTKISEITASEHEGNVLNVLGNKTTITSITANLNTGTLVNVVGNGTKITSVTANNNTNGIVISITGDDAVVQTITAENNTNEIIVNVVGNNTKVSSITSNNDVGGCVVKTQGLADIRTITVTNGTGKVIDANGDKTEIRSVSVTNHTGDVISLVGNNTKIITVNANNNTDGTIVKTQGTSIIETVNVVNGTGTVIDANGVETEITGVTANNHAGDVINLVGGQTRITTVTADNNTDGTVIKTQGPSNIQKITVTGGNGQIIDANGDGSVINTVTVTNHTGNVISLIGNNTDIGPVTANNNTKGTVIKSRGKSNIHDITINGGDGVAIDANGDETQIKGVNATDFKGNIVNAIGNIDKIITVAVKGGNGTIINATGDGSFIEDINATGHNGDVVNVVGNDTRVAHINAIDNTNGTIVKTQGECYIEDVTVKGGEGTGVEFDGNKTIVKNVKTTDFNGDVVTGKGNNVSATDITATGGEGTVLNITGNDAFIGGINSIGHNGTTTVINGTGAKGSDLPANVNFNLPATSGPDATFSMTCLSSASGTFIVTIDGNKTTRVAVVNGSASITLNLAPGKYGVLLEFDGNTTYANEHTSGSIEIKEPVITLTASDVGALYSAKAEYKVLVLADGVAVANGTKVLIKFNGKTTEVETVNGYATLALTTTLKVGKYTITATYKDKTATNTVAIKNIINANKLKKLKKSKKVNKVKVTLSKVNGKYIKGVKLTLKLKGKKVATAKTNAKGAATFKVKKKSLKKFKKGKKVTATVTYGKDVVTKKVKIA